MKTKSTYYLFHTKQPPLVPCKGIEGTQESYPLSPSPNHEMNFGSRGSNDLAPLPHPKFSGSHNFHSKQFWKKRENNLSAKTPHTSCLMKNCLRPILCWVTTTSQDSSLQHLNSLPKAHTTFLFHVFGARTSSVTLHLHKVILLQKVILLSHPFLLSMHQSYYSLSKYTLKALFMK